MKFKRVDLFALIIASSPFLYWLRIRNELKGPLPIHWGFDGKPDQWESAQNISSFLLVLASVSLIVYAILRALKKLDPKRTAQLNETTAEKVGLGVVTIFSAISLMILLAPQFRFDLTRGLFLLISLFFAFLGNVMYNIKPNHFIGLRLPWTLEDESNWRSTHRLAGLLWFICGFTCAVLSLLIRSDIMSPIFFAVAVSLIAIPTLYSFLLFKRARRS